MRSLALIAFGLAGCATIELGQPETEANATYLVCGSAVRLDISHDGRAAVLREEGRETILERVQSSLGTRYAGGGVSILRSGDAYIYTDRDGGAVACDLLPR